MKRLLLAIAALALLGLGSLAQASVFDLGTGFTNLETVAVGDAGNAADTRYTSLGCGSVGYNYNMGKYEVTAKQYTDFLNAKAEADDYGLYSTAMADTSNAHVGCNIQRSGASGSYAYSVADDWANRPVNYVSYWDACRFANWLGNGQGNGDTETGAYTLTTSGIANNTITRNAGWTWAVTSEDEWYKAAYYKGDGTNTGYWNYPTSSDTAPGRDMADAAGNNANVSGSGSHPIDSGKYLTVVGEFQNSDSPYGTFDQAGNVWEWNETIVGVAYRVLRGGSYAYGYDGYGLQASSRDLRHPMVENSIIGFRVSEVPEPSSIIALLGGLVGLLGIRRRSRAMANK